MIKDIEVIDYLLSVTKDNQVIVLKVEILVSIDSFKDGHIGKRVFNYLNKTEREYYIYEGNLIIPRVTV